MSISIELSQGTGLAARKRIPFDEMSITLARTTGLCLRFNIFSMAGRFGLKRGSRCCRTCYSSAEDRNIHRGMESVWPSPWPKAFTLTRAAVAAGR
jgi:hypothetical protein